MPSSISATNHADADSKESTRDADAQSSRSTKSKRNMQPETISRLENGDGETASLRSVRSSTSNARSVASSSAYSSSTLSRSASGSALRASGSSIATSVVSLRDLETRKAEIELELQRVQRELEERQTHERRSHAERPLALLPATARVENNKNMSRQDTQAANRSVVAVSTRGRPHIAPPGAHHR